MAPPRPWKPFTVPSCCAVESRLVVLGNLSRCRPNRSEFSKKVAELPSFRRPPFSDLSSSSSACFNEDQLYAQTFGAGLFAFQLNELRAITHDFSTSYLLGEGGFGTVHKGYVDDKMRPGLKAQAVAVKLLDIEGLQGHGEWLAEVIFLGQLRHRHLVRLLGYCCEDEERLLVYEFMSRGSLENHLFRRVSVSLSWGTRLKIAIGAAKGLAFLHGMEKPVIYRDFKTSNILLDSVRKEDYLCSTDFTPKLSDFGLAKMLLDGKDTHVTTRVMGTQGYAAPEYVMTGHLTTKSDVYSYGVVMLEMLTGRRSVDKSRPKSEEKLLEWSKPYLSSSRKLRCIMDPKLAGQYSVNGARDAATLALRCISTNPKDRPRMSEVVDTLQGMQNLRDMAGRRSAPPASPLAGRKAVSASSGFAGNRGLRSVSA